MTLHVHHAPDTELLAAGLAEVLAEPTGDPFDEEVVVVPAKGVERWLTQRLSHRLGAGARGADGVCAGVRFLSPRSLVSLLTGTEHEDPWDPERMVWPLLEVIDASLEEPWCAPLARHLGRGEAGELGELRRDRRWSVARRLAGLFASYAVQRPALLQDWRAERATDGAGSELPSDLAWQPPLWRALLERVGAAPPDVRHADTVAALAAGQLTVELPDRLSMFGHTRLPRTELELLRALATVREVHLWLPQVSPVVWRQLEQSVSDGPVRRRDDDSGARVRHPLLASLGRDSRELQRSLACLGPRIDHFHEAPSASRDTLLGRLQDALRADEPRPEEGGFVGDDRSLQVHACHGSARQVEVLREVLVGLLQDDPTLEPRDIVVMCPDVEAYAPLFSATFGLLDTVGEQGHPGHQLRVRLADRGLSATNPLLALAGALVELAGGRATASEVLDLASRAPVRHRFAFDDEEIAELTGWVGRAGVRWGLTAQLREPFGLQEFEENTWRAGLDRVLLGVAAAEGPVLLGDRVPLDDIGSSSIDLAGRLAELVDRLEAAVTGLRAADTLPAWLAALREGVESLGSVPEADAWQEAQFHRELDTLADEAAYAGADGFEGPLRLADVRILLARRLQPRPTRANFRTGHLTVCTMVPMRSVPHRVVCLIGLDDGAFPRTTVPDGDDVLQRDPLTGERDLRSEDRQLLLDAVMAAGETLVVTYTGASVTTNQDRPPAVPLDELLDSVEALAPGARAHVVRRHPLQPFDPRCFEQADPFSFDARYADAARALQEERRRPRPFLLEPLPARDRGEVADLQLADLQTFFRHPVAAFLRHGLDVTTPQEIDEADDAMPLDLGPLDAWAIGDRILRRILAAGSDQAAAEAILAAELRRGDLPPRGLGERALADVCAKVQDLATAAHDDLAAEPTRVDVTVDLGDGRRLTGVVPDVRGDRIVRVYYSKLAPKRRLEAWIDLLALTAADPDRSWTAVTYGRFKRYSKQGVAWSRLGPLDERAPELLRQLVDVRDHGIREPLPLFAKASAAYAEAVRKGDDAVVKATYDWRGSDRVPGEQTDAAHVRVFGPQTELARILGQPRDDEDWNTEPTRAGRYALRVWEPLLAAETRKNL